MFLVVFPSDADFRYYLDALAKYKEVYDVCLMTNHVHRLLAPSDHAGLSGGKHNRTHQQDGVRSCYLHN